MLFVSLRRAHTAVTEQNNTRIYNTKPNVIEGGWKPQVPGGPVHDGWAFKRWPFRCNNHNVFFVGFLVFCAAGFWAPFTVVQYQMKKNNK